MRSMIVSSFALTTVLGACEEPYSGPITGPNGRTAFMMNCSNVGQSLQKCYEDAVKFCPSGYDIVESRSDVVGVPLATGGMIIGAEQSLFIECKA